MGVKREIVGSEFFPMKFMISWDIIGGFSMNIWDFPGCYGILWDIFS